ncbi:MAG: TOBE domain-containing protein, partial [Gemmatimonadota bacterium]|nr:TOBE domain-containing protein [Gemmatimonadota bacterium]
AVAPASGPRWLAVLRPESLSIDYAERAEGPSWAGEVVSRRFAGGHVVYAVRLAGDARVEVSTDDGTWTEGQSVTVRLGEKPVALVAP